jgi:hypothetical protein
MHRAPYGVQIGWVVGQILWARTPSPISLISIKVGMKRSGIVYMFSESDPMPRPTKRSGEWRITIWVLLSSWNPGRLVGIFTERGYAWNAFLKRLLFSLIRASATSCVVYLPPRPAGRRGDRLYNRQACAALPMIDGGNLCRIVSVWNLVRASSDRRSSATEFVLEQLEHCIDNSQLKKGEGSPTFRKLLCYA